MRNLVADHGVRCVRLSVGLLVLSLLLAGAANADVATAGEYSVTGAGGVSLKVAFASAGGIKILQQNGNWLFMPGRTSVTYTVTAGTSASFPLVNFIKHGLAGFPGSYESIPNGGSFTVPFNGATQDFVVYFVHSDGSGTANAAITMHAEPAQCFISANAPGDPENDNAGGGQYLDNMTASEDVFNTSFKVHVVKPSPRGPSDYDPAPGAQVKVWYLGTQWRSANWATCDSNGDATVVLGAGGVPVLTAQAGVLATELYLRVNPAVPGTTTTSPGYCERIYVLPKFARLAGSLDLSTWDMDEHPLPSNVWVWGGPFLPGLGANTISDSIGHATLKINPPGLPESPAIEHFETKSPPRVNLEWVYTQLIDFPGKLTEKIPCYISPRYTLHPEAYTYDPTGAGYDFPKCSGGRIELLDDVSGKVIDEKPVEISFFQPNQSKQDKRHDRKFMPVRATHELKVYHARVVFDDPDGSSKDGKLIASEELHYNIQATAEPRNPKPYYNIEVVTCAVGAWSGDEEGSFNQRVPRENLLVQMETFAEMFPGPVAFSFGGTIQPSFWPWQSGPWVVSALISQLQERQRASAGVDRMVGIVPPGWLQAFYHARGAQGVTIKGVEGALLFDIVEAKPSVMFHEFLHTVGLPDIKVGNYLGVPDQRPPSANGYRPALHMEILNILGRETFTTRIMYECMVNDAWLHTDEHLAVMQHLYTPAKSFQSPDMVTAPKAEPGPRMRLHGHFNLNGNQAVLDPVFADVGEPCNPYPSTPQYANMFYVELLGIDQAQVGIYYIPIAAPVLQFTPGAGQTTPVEDMPLDSRFSALFDFSVPAVAGLTAVRMGYAGLGSSPVLWKTISLSASTPVLQWVNQPTGTLSQPTTIEWTSNDADGANLVLAHEFYVSADGGSTWRQVANRIPSHVAGEQQVYSYRFDPASWPAGNQYRFKVLASDGLRTGELATSANAAVSGYDPNPKAELLIAKWEASRPESGFFTVLVPLRNGGRGTLEVWPDLATLPDWLSQTDLEPAKLSPMSDGLLLLSGKQNAMGTFETTITLNTNDPATPKFTLPLKLIQQTSALAPRIARIELFPNYPDSHAWQPGEMVRLTLWDNDCRPAMEAFVTISQQGPAKTALVTDLPMESGSLPGEYRIDWTIPADAADGRYGLVFTLHDPAAGLDTKHNSRTLTVQRYTTPEGEGEGDTHVMVPNVEGQTQAVATATLTSQNLVVGTVTQECSDAVAAGNVLRQSPAENESILAGSAVALTVSSGPCHVTVPNLLGLTQASAAAAVPGAHLVVGSVVEQCSDTVAKGKVIGQNPEAGQQVLIESAVVLTISAGSCHPQVPTLFNLSQAASAAALADHNLVLGAVTEQCTQSVAAGNVMRQSPPAGTVVEGGSAVSVTLSSGVCPPPTVPNLSGMTQSEADRALAGQNLVIGTVEKWCNSAVAAGIIFAQSPVPGTIVATGSFVSLTISTGPCGGEGEIREGEDNLPDTPAEAAHDLRGKFDDADTDHSGGLSLPEATEALPGLPEELFAQVDGNGDGQITPDEINTLIAVEVTVQDLINAFATADADHNGGLSEAEFSAALPGLTHDQFVQLDTNGDGQITLDELSQLLNPGGCACSKSSLTIDGLKGRMADLFLMGLVVTSLLVVAGRKP